LERFAPLAGTVAVVFFVIPFLLFEVAGDPPGDDATGEEILAYLRDDRASILIGLWMFFLGLVFFLWFLGSLRATFFRVEGGVGQVATIAYSAGVGTVLLMAATLAPELSSVIAVEENENLSPQAAEALWVLDTGFFIGATFFLAVFFAASAAIVLRTGLLPRWFGIVTAILAVAGLIPFIAWAVLLFAMPLWLIGVSLWLFLRPGPAEAAPESA
jgi:hypothetical protein